MCIRDSTIEDFRSVWLEEEHNPPAFARARVPKVKDVPQPEEQIDPTLEHLADQATEREISTYLQQDDIRALDDNLRREEAERVERARRGAEAAAAAAASAARVSSAPDDLDDLDEDELDALILTEDEVRVKERVWMEFNKDYLEAALARQLKLEADQKAGIAPAPRSVRIC